MVSALSVLSFQLAVPCPGKDAIFLWCSFLQDLNDASGTVRP